MPADRRDLRRRLFTLATGQAGYFAASQAKELGYSYQAQAHHVSAGNWTRVDRGIFRLVEWIPDIHDDLARWTLWSKGKGVVSHESALAVHAIGDFESTRVQLTVPRDFSMTDTGVGLHRGELAAVDVDSKTGFQVTSAARSIIDVAADGADEEQLARVIAEGQTLGLFSLRTLRSRSEVVDPRSALYIERAIARMMSS
jgi:predicted transcriptional regulator of viral defense system